MQENVVTKGRGKIFDIVYIALFTVLIVICSWISVPSAVPFTLQTFGIFCTAGFLGGKRGLASVMIYILLGAVGLPVFSGGSSGFGVLLGPTGGYIIGFLMFMPIYWLIAEKLSKDSTRMNIIAMIAGMLVCYTFGTLWFQSIYAIRGSEIGFVAALGMYVLPYLLPDAIKLVLAIRLVKKLRRYKAKI